MTSTNNIKVICRFRPTNLREKRYGEDSVVRFLDNRNLSFESLDYNGIFTFDQIFKSESKQKDIFAYSIAPTIDDIFQGFNGTVFAYGQTGSGKTYTMLGTDIFDNESKGIIPRITEQIFQKILESPTDIEYTVKVSYMEIYMEKVKDLLNPSNDNLPIHEDRSRGVYVKDLVGIYVSSVEEIFDVMRRGSTARAVATTNMNTESSRSHTIFVLQVLQRSVDTGSSKSGRLFLVDLAGSEKVGKSGATGQTLEEAKKINKSLSTLGMVINALADGKSNHIPYRDSKLTRILTESLGGNSRTTLIINCSPASYNQGETLSTLRFGTRAKTIKNNAKINAELSPLELKSRLRKANETIVTYERYIKDLINECQQWRNGQTLPKSSWSICEIQNDLRNLAPSPRPDYLARATDFVSGRDEISVDEKEEFLRRENELSDQISEKESQIVEFAISIKSITDELKESKRKHETARIKYIEKCKEYDELRTSTQSKDVISNFVPSEPENTEIIDQSHKLREELVKGIMDELDSKILISNQIKKVLGYFDASDGPISGEIRNTAQSELQEVFVNLNLAERVLDEKFKFEKLLISNNTKLEQELLESRDSIQVLLKRIGSEVSIDQVVNDLKTHFNKKMADQQLKIQLLEAQLAEAQAIISTKVEANLNEMESGKLLHHLAKKQTREFENMREKLMLELENRCDRIISLEMCLDETRDQVEEGAEKCLKKKMESLEHNLEQQTIVQKQLVEQNMALKKDVAISERKLVALNEKIQQLEILLQDAQDRLGQQNARFESQLQAVRERLEQARVNRLSTQGALNFGEIGVRIAKPLRGGGNAENA